MFYFSDFEILNIVELKANYLHQINKIIATDELTEETQR